MKTIAFGILPLVDLLKYTDVSDVCGASIIGMRMEAVRTSETSVYFNETTSCYIPEGYQRIILWLGEKLLGSQIWYPFKKIISANTGVVH
jgi:hypothetical protein